MALNTTVWNNISNTSFIITGDAVCFRDPNWYYYSNSQEAFCEELVWSTEYLNILSSVIIGILGFYQLTWENHNYPILRVISGLLIICSISSVLNHYNNTRSYMLLENFTMNLIQYMVLSIVAEKYCRNVQVLLNKSGEYHSTITQTKSQFLTGLNWTFSTFCIYFLLYRDINGCEWGTFVYKFGYLFPICILLIFVGFAYYLDHKYKIKVGTICNSFDIATKAFNYFQSGASLLFIGSFVWILMQSTCIPNSGIEYIPAHFTWHLLFGYGYILIDQYYIFLTNDLNGNRMILSQRTTNTYSLLNILFPYFMKQNKEETERMLNDIKPTGNMGKLSVSHPNPKEIKDLRKSIETLNRERKARKLQQKLQKQQQQKQKNAQQRNTKYDDFDVNDYMDDNNDNTTIVYEDFDDKVNNNEIELQMVQKNNNGNDVEEEGGDLNTTDAP